MSDELLPIGRFARLAGLTIGALRHYDEAGILPPADVDPATGYRRYRRDQVAAARAVAALRDLELSLPAIRALLEAEDEGARRSVLHGELTRLEARTARLQRALHRLGVLSVADTSPRVGPSGADDPTSISAAPAPKEITVPTPPQPPELTPETHRALGKGLYNRAWDLLEIEDRTPAQDDELVHTAHASAWHWSRVGNAANAARAHWLCSRVYAVLGRGQASLHHARRANEILAAGGEGIEDWDAAGAAEAMARALAVSGDLAGAADWKARATAALDGIANPLDRAPIEGDLATLPV